MAQFDFLSGADAYQAQRELQEYEESKITLVETKKFLEFKGDELHWNMHSGQIQAMESKKRFIVCLGSRQSGKTECGPPWLYEEMKTRGPGNYMVVAPSYPLLQASALPKFIRLFVDVLKLGKMQSKPLQFNLSEYGEQVLFGHKQSALDKTVVAFGHGANPASLEARPAVLGTWVDEGGQPGFKQGSWEALEGRMTNTGGRMLSTSTPYDWGYLKTHYYDPWETSGKTHADIDVIQWESCANPNFPRSEFERLRATMPSWKFQMFYCGQYSLPSGLIYDVAADPDKAPVVIPPFDIPNHWLRYVGVDFGGMNTFGVFAALDPQEMVAYVYKEYYPEKQYAIITHARKIKKLSGGRIESIYGGAKSEGQWREEFSRADMFVHEPQVPNIDVGIARIYNLMSQGRLKIFNGVAPTDKINKELFSYRYKVDPDTGDVLPSMEIMDKSRFHAMDSIRYLGGGLGFLLLGGLEEGAVGGGRKWDEPVTIDVQATSSSSVANELAVVGGHKTSSYRPSTGDILFLQKLKRTY